MNKETKIIWKNIDDLKPYEHNAKEHDETQVKNLAKSIEKYGWQNPVLIDKDNVIIAGHGRVLGAKELGLTEVPCIYADDLTEEQVKEYRIVDNKLTESAWLDDELSFELEELDLSEFDLDFDVDEEFNEQLLEYMQNDTFADIENNLETFGVTFQFPKKYEKDVKEFIQNKTKDYLVKIMIGEILNA